MDWSHHSDGNKNNSKSHVIIAGWNVLISFFLSFFTFEFQNISLLTGKGIVLLASRMDSIDLQKSGSANQHGRIAKIVLLTSRIHPFRFHAILPLINIDQPDGLRYH